jgi:hypothetical protein
MRLGVMLLVLTALCVASPHAFAKKKRKTVSKLNMPKGWSWPPSAPMKKEGERCLKDLTRLGLKWKKAKAERKIATPVVIEDMDFGGLKLAPRYGKGPWVMDCHLARAFARYVAPALLDMHVVEVRFGQIHKYRDVAGKPGVLSRHSLGLAMDVYAFVTDDGQVHVVEGDYVDGDEVLLEVERRVDLSGGFRLLLTPGNDFKRHHDHFHFEVRTAGDKALSKAPKNEPLVVEVDDDHLIDHPNEEADPRPGSMNAGQARGN